MASRPDVVVLGIRHHGPGSARSVRTALQQIRPATVVIEGPPELDALIDWAGDPDLIPPVAALVYRPDNPARSAFYPFAAFSPEWQALRWAVDAGVAVRFADLPAVNALADLVADDDRQGTLDLEGDGHARPVDPIGALAAAAGYDDPERWWEDTVEHRHGTLDAFDAIREAMEAVRSYVVDDLEMRRREAAMRKVLRAAAKDAGGPVVVVCGAYHAPALHPDGWPPAAEDARTLRGLTRKKVTATWVPWTHARLAATSGYGAGVTSPGWYAHCHATEDIDRTHRWMVVVARALRSEGLPAPPASVVAATRLADALAAVRGRPNAGLAEVTDATLAVLCGGHPEPLQVVTREVLVGHDLGAVPDSVPMVPLARDLATSARGARLKFTDDHVNVTVDLRQAAGLAKSVLLHRCQAIGIRWGVQADAGATTGTFKEAWILRWDPVFEVDIIAASVWGTTLQDAATARLLADAREADRIRDLVLMLDTCVTADLPHATRFLVDLVDRHAANSHDTVALMLAAEPLARLVRYGSVRGFDTDRVAEVLDRVIRRITAGLPAALTGLDDDAAATSAVAFDQTASAIRLLDHDALTDLWVNAVNRTVATPRVHPNLHGRCVRLLHDREAIDHPEVAGHMGRAISAAVPGREAAGWIDGFLAGDAALLLVDPGLLGLIDAWVTALAADTFDDLLPLLRRTFSRHTSVERDRIGQRLRHGHRDRVGTADRWDEEQATPAMIRVLDLLGISA